MQDILREQLTALILAGGRGRRMGGQDKGLITLNKRPLIEHILDAVGPQVGRILINANRNQAVYASYARPVISDELSDFQGPLAGFACGLANSETDYILTLPCDSPLVATDYAQRMADALTRHRAEIAVAHDGERMQPVYALIPRRLHSSLLDFLNGGDRKIDRWYAAHEIALVDFSDQCDMFRNINTPQDREQLELNEADL